MQHVILGLLMLAPMSLYDLHKQFTGGASLFYAASYGSLQRALAGLVERGLVTAEAVPGSARGRRVHTVTPQGRAAWEAWMREPLTGAGAETAMLAKVYLAGLLPAEGRAEVLGVLREHAAAALADLQAFARDLDAQEVGERHAEIFRYQRATLEYGLRSHALALEWLGEVADGM
ncbi:PadR family transcriptional regulator [Serinibacter salmoneus]|uniref:PadR family transcriptional regulator n=1 Tax=Serinibacter salmoneus TaxID=556530 RepID=A0A2A9D519_9MICO|nr:PadR family transcriptional regulator [Serinibacter salmoneus]PFG20950.1 PadR family transcriptional regulator [Serinibacter salmoneus]